MPSRQPRAGDKVWSEARHLNGYNPNGIIYTIRRRDEVALIKWDQPDRWHPNRDFSPFQHFMFDELEGHWEGETRGYCFRKIIRE